jgi:hypothetical protein
MTGTEAVSIAVGYTIESALFFVIGVIFSILFALCNYARQYPWNKEKASRTLVRFTQKSSLICSILMIIWQADPKTHKGMYSVWFVLFLKDIITCLLLAGAILLCHTLYVVIMEQKMTKKQSKFKNPVYGVGIPMVVLFFIAISSTIISYRTNEEIYRVLFFAAATIILAVVSVVSWRMFSVIRASERAVAQRTSLTSKHVQERTRDLKKKLTRSVSIATVLTVLEFYTTIEVIVARRSLQATQAPDPQHYEFSPIPLMFVLGLTISLFYCWLPFKKPIVITPAPHQEKDNFSKTLETPPRLTSAESTEAKATALPDLTSQPSEPDSSKILI